MNVYDVYVCDAPNVGWGWGGGSGQGTDWGVSLSKLTIYFFVCVGGGGGGEWGCLSKILSIYFWGYSKNRG